MHHFLYLNLYLKPMLLPQTTDSSTNQYIQLIKHKLEDCQYFLPKSMDVLTQQVKSCCFLFYSSAAIHPGSHCAQCSDQNKIPRWLPT